MKYIATFSAGTYPIIAKHLKSFKPADLKLIENDESSVVFESPLSAEKLIELRYFTNIFAVIDNQDITCLLKGKYFRLMYVKNGEPKQLSTSERTVFESKIKRDFNLVSDARQSRNDFYVIQRQSGTKLFTLRLARAKFKRDKLLAGELRPELAHILCLAAGVKAKHVTVDMFAGNGAILQEAVRGFGVKRAIAIDTKKHANRHEMPQIKWYQASSALKLKFLADNSIDRIVTDPPWGNYDESVDVSVLYPAFIKEAQRVLKVGGVMIVLSGYDNTEKYLNEINGLSLVAKWSVLVSGKKAVVYKLQKTLI